MYLIDPKTLKMKSVMDDGTYVIKDGVVVGRQTLNEAEKKESIAMQAKFESNFIYYTRYFLLLIGLLFVLFVITMLLLMVFVFCVILTDMFVGQSTEEQRRRMSVDNAMRNGRMMNVMKRIPYANFMLKEARDCPICLESFNEKSQVVQLKCSKYHIFHYDCMERYLETGKDLCPLCRKPIEI